MSAKFLYFIPPAFVDRPMTGVRLTRAELMAGGLGYAFETDSLARRQCAKGPDGSGGLIIGDAREKGEENIGYHPDRQTWQRLPNSTAWVGRYNHEQIGPEDLTRRSIIRGHAVTLLDGARWTVPMARGAVEEDGDLRWTDELPKVIKLDEEGKAGPSGTVRRFQALWDLAAAWHDGLNRHFAEDAKPEDSLEETFPLARRFAIAVEILAFNYRLGPAEVSLLELVDDDALMRILGAAIDMPSRNEIAAALAAKKNQPDEPGSSSSAGAAVSTPDTDRR